MATRSNVGETFAGLPFEKAVELTEKVKPMLGTNASMADLSMRWILDHDAVTTVIPGASKPEQAASNVRASTMAPVARNYMCNCARVSCEGSEAEYSRTLLIIQRDETTEGTENTEAGYSRYSRCPR